MSLNFGIRSKKLNIDHIHFHNASLGIIVGNGFVGNTTPKTKEMNTFLSVDGGENWDQIQVGPHFIQSSDYGEIISLVPANKFTNSLKFSWNMVRIFKYFKGEKLGNCNI